MSSLNIALPDGGSAASIIVLDQSLVVRGSAFLTPPNDTKATVKLLPGLYTIRATRPNGGSFDEKIRLEGESQDVVLSPPTSPHEWLEDVNLFGDLPPSTAPIPSVSPSWPFPRNVRFDVDSLDLITSRGSGGVARRLSACVHWRPLNQDWRYAEPMDTQYIMSNDYLRSRVAAPARGIAAVEFHEEGRPGLFVLYPGSLDQMSSIAAPRWYEAPFSPVQSQITKADFKKGLAAPPIELRVLCEDAQLQSVLQFLNGSSPEYGEAMASNVQIGYPEEWVGLADLPPEDDSYQAFLFMKGKFSSPAKAAAGGLFLLRFGQIERLGDWPRNLADYFPWLPEGPVIEGWRRLMLPPEESNPSYPQWRIHRPPPKAMLDDECGLPNAPRPDDPLVDASLRFLEAEARGIPVFREGLQALDSGLRYCYRAVDDETLRNRLRGAIQRLMPFLQYAVDVGAFTAFLGSSPSRAGLEPSKSWAVSPPPSILFSVRVTPFGFSEDKRPEPEPQPKFMAR